MSSVWVGLLLVFLVYALFVGACVAVALLLPSSFLGGPAKAVLTWLPPFLGGDALRNWAATTAERLAKARLAGKRTGETAAQLAAEMEEGAMRAMLPTAGIAELGRIMACPETGQGMIGVTAPEALAIAAYLRKNRSRAEQRQIYELAVENAKKIAARAPGAAEKAPLPCPLHGADHVCCVYGNRPLQCRPLHAIAIAKDLGGHSVSPAGAQTEGPNKPDNEHAVAQGIEIGLTRALKSAGVDASVYELNSALATALETPDAADRWARGENVFHSPLR
jgi:hypothetical protein